jgi:hypothetical protein
MIENKNNVFQRLIRHMAINKTSGCWEWVGSKRNGYGRIIIGSRTDGTRKSMSAHRVSYELKYGEIPEGMEVCHKCDNPCCVNPDHLFLGTRQDNIDDRVRRAIEEEPTVDAVEVCRCKDCVNYCGFEHCKNGICDGDSVSKRAVFPDDFCSYGERRTDES